MPDDYRNADRCCDLVMKGGITSGILYPPAICRIAERFHLVGIGGTSAGAIAACAAAAAEYRRRTQGDGAGFQLLEQLPRDLGGEGRLTGLFRPDRSTRKLHKLFLGSLGLEDRGWFARVRWKARVLWSVIRHKKTLRPAIENGFGVCTGMGNGNPPGAGEIAPLTAWLSETIDTIGGKGGVTPLTFGDLRHAPIPVHLADTMTGRDDRSIDLQAVTTCVTFGRPYELPFDEDGRRFAFDPNEWKRLFPTNVLDYLVETAKAIDAPTLARDGKLPLPVGDALPVIVAARMSLSFPGLFTMVPLYAVDFEHKGETAQKPLRKVWFSDGGITSNLPIHRFDGLFPRWPTLGINLQYTDKSGEPARGSVGPSMIHMIQRPGDGILELWNAFDGSASPVGKMLGFANAVFRSAQVWHDNGFLRLPGYRDRVVEIWLTSEEGGMNLTMPQQTIDELVRRGNEAGSDLRDRFLAPAEPNVVSWDGHRWARLRSWMSGLAAALHDFKRCVDHPMPGDVTLHDFLSAKDAPPYYRFDTNAQFDNAKAAILELLKYAESLQKMPVCDKPAEAPVRPFCGPPRPPVEVGSRARF